MQGSCGPPFPVSEYGATPVSTTRVPFDLRISGPDSAVLDRLADGALQLARRRQEIAFEVGRLYLAALSAQDLLETAEATRCSLETLAGATDRLVEQGRAARLEAESREREARRQVEIAHLALDLARGASRFDSGGN